MGKTTVKIRVMRVLDASIINVEFSMVVAVISAL